MAIKEIVEQYLKDNGYDGLWNPDVNCGCAVDDLFPCSGDNGGIIDCEPGYRVPCDGNCDWGGECEFHIVPKRPKGGEE